ncbi:MAG: DinB family protein [Candidatus Hodarchaeales archaeon]|jgi:uncharacterized damage-inducible protein DinB
MNTISFSVDKDETNPKLSKLILMLIDTRKGLLSQLNGFSQDALDYSPNINKIETIGTLLLHIAGIEWSWIFEDIDNMEMDYEEWKYGFALREKLDPVQLTGKPLQYYIDKLDKVRKDVLIRLEKMNDSDLKKEVIIGNDKFSIEWIIYHLFQHESVHIGQINFLKRQYNYTVD